MRSILPSVNILEFAMNDDGHEKLLKKLMVIFALF